MTTFHNTDILSTQQFSKDDLHEIFSVAKALEPIANGEKTSALLQGKVLASLFFEASTRTRLSFETAMLRLGGGVVSMAEAGKSSSTTKGETLADMARIVGGYADVIAMRHPEEGAVSTFAEHTSTPVLNAGDGPGEHPTQALIDLYTIQKEKGTIDNLTIGLCGDLRYGRTVHSLATVLFHYPSVKLVLISAGELKMPPAILQSLQSNGVTVTEVDSFADSLADLDVLYMTRVQRERFPNQQAYEKTARHCELSRALLDRAKDDLTVLHPLPRITEIPAELDDDPRCKYFDQARNGVPIRMALLAMVTGMRP